jgi:hypothetical protein
LPKTTIKRMEKIRRRFFFGKEGNCKGSTI